MGRKILPRDGVIDQMGLARDVGHLICQPINRIGLIDLCIKGVNGGNSAGHAVRLIGPKIRTQAKLIGGVCWIKRVEINAAPGDDDGVGIGRRWSLPIGCQDHICVGFPKAFCAKAGRKLIPHQVQPTACAQFGQAHRQPKPAGQNLTHCDQHGGAADFVGLRRAVHPFVQKPIFAHHRIRNSGPKDIVVHSIRRIHIRQRIAAQYQRM